MNPTRATPIISAAAVLAVRFGVRIAFSRPNVPLTPPNRAIGAPMIRAAGRASTGASTATAMKVTRAPSPTSAMVPPLRPATSEPTPATRIELPTTIRRRELAARSMATARIAAIGGMRPARRAGMTADTSVTTVPIAKHRAIVLIVTTTGPAGISIPKAASRAFNSLATPMPATTPAIDEISPTTVASRSTDRVTCRLLAPRARSNAISFWRWATMIEKVLKMMNAPTNRAIRAKTIRNVLKNDRPSFTSPCVSAVI